MRSLIMKLKKNHTFIILFLIFASFSGNALADQESVFVYFDGRYFNPDLSSDLRWVYLDKDDDEPINLGSEHVHSTYRDLNLTFRLLNNSSKEVVSLSLNTRFQNCRSRSSFKMDETDFAIPAGEFKDFTVTFDPQSTGNLNCTFELRDTSKRVTIQEISIRGLGRDL